MQVQQHALAWHRVALTGASWRPVCKTRREISGDAHLMGDMSTCDGDSDAKIYQDQKRVDNPNVHNGPFSLKSTALAHTLVQHQQLWRLFSAATPICDGPRDPLTSADRLQTASNRSTPRVMVHNPVHDFDEDETICGDAARDEIFGRVSERFALQTHPLPAVSAKQKLTHSPALQHHRSVIARSEEPLAGAGRGSNLVLGCSTYRYHRRP